VLASWGDRGVNCFTTLRAETPRGLVKGGRENTFSEADGMLLWSLELVSSSPLANQLGFLVGAILRERVVLEMALVHSHGISQLKPLLTSCGFLKGEVGGVPEMGESYEGLGDR